MLDFIYDTIYGWIDVSGDGNDGLSYLGFYGYASYYGIIFSF